MFSIIIFFLLIETLNTERNMPLIDEITKLSTSEPFKFHHPATISLSVFTKYGNTTLPSLFKYSLYFFTEVLREKIIEKKSYSAFIRMLKDSPASKCPGSSLQQTYIAIINLMKSGTVTAFIANFIIFIR